MWLCRSFSQASPDVSFREALDPNSTQVIARLVSDNGPLSTFMPQYAFVTWCLARAITFFKLARLM
jgi:hypothetical protein